MIVFLKQYQSLTRCSWNLQCPILWSTCPVRALSLAPQGELAHHSAEVACGMGRYETERFSFRRYLASVATMRLSTLSSDGRYFLAGAIVTPRTKFLNADKGGMPAAPLRRGYGPQPMRDAHFPGRMEGRSSASKPAQILKFKVRRTAQCKVKTSYSVTRK